MYAVQTLILRTPQQATRYPSLTTKGFVTHSGAKNIGIPKKKAFEALFLFFLTPALSVLDTWMCRQHSDLPERNILLTRKYGSKKYDANRDYLLNVFISKQIVCSGFCFFLLQNIKFLTFLFIHKFFSFPDEKLQKKVCNHIQYVFDTCKWQSLF